MDNEEAKRKFVTDMTFYQCRGTFVSVEEAQAAAELLRANGFKGATVYEIETRDGLIVRQKVIE